MEQVIGAAVDLLLEKQARARGLVKRPRKTVAATAIEAPVTHPAPPTQPTPAPTSPEVSNRMASESPMAIEPPPLRRDGPREAIPVAVKRAVWKRDGGRTEDNLRLLCGRHDQLAAPQAFGSRCVERYAGGKEGSRRTALPSPRLDPQQGS
jgi:hypothetical protein